MNSWMIVGIVVCLLVFAGIAVVNAIDAEPEAETVPCATCGNSCTAQKNCGLGSCGAVSGGSCGCSK